ncbi:hypothetical protein MNBD_BACTEROID05-1260 [hydrothermal vent metagenome]|uniref:ArnT-like N-terminal domain-containing protein n=1 Tax=hydrothermal vent metagenome TaxID=652676 RepID=A0A3B0TUA4_9ZZZZ
MTKLSVRAKLFWCFIFFWLIGINIFTLKEGHNWGGDFSQYIIHAQNIASHRPYVEGITLNPSVVYPPGFPFILSSFVAAVGVNLKIFKLINVIFWFLSILCFWSLFSKKMSHQGAFLCALLLGSSSEFFVFKQNILSDIPFAFFVSLSLFLFMKYDEQGQKEKSCVKNHFFWLLIGAMVSAFLTRTAGVVLFVSFISYSFLLRRGRIKDVLLTGGALCLAFIFQGYLIGIHPSAVNNIVNDPLSFLAAMGKNHSIVFSSMVRSFLPPVTLASEFFLISMQKILAFILWPLYCLIIWIVFRRIKHRTLTFAECFLFFYILLLFVWSGHGVFNFVRFIIPVMGVILLVLAELFQWMNNKFLQKGSVSASLKGISNIIVGGIIVFNLWNIGVIFNFDDDVLEKKENKELFQWVIQNIPLDKHYLFDYERVMALKTGRIGTSLRAILIDESAIEIPDFSKILNKKGVEYVVFSKLKDQAVLSVIGVNKNVDQYGLKFLWENNLYRIFQVI